MAIDYGDARIGIALTDPLQIISSGYKTLVKNPNVYEEILNICKDKSVESIVIGIPFDQDSKVGEAAKKVFSFVKLLKEFLNKNDFRVNFFEQDERYSTIDAKNSMRDIKVKRNNMKNVIDQIAAANILREFMNSNYKTPLREQ